jgi:hypothetical protein
MMCLHFDGRCSLNRKSLKMQGQHSGSPKCDVGLPGRTAVHRDMIHCVLLTGDRRGIHQLLLRYQCLHRQWRVLRLDDASVLQTVTVTCIVVSQQHTFNVSDPRSSATGMCDDVSKGTIAMKASQPQALWLVTGFALYFEMLNFVFLSPSYGEAIVWIRISKSGTAETSASPVNLHSPILFCCYTCLTKPSPVYCHVTPCQVRCF